MSEELLTCEICGRKGFTKTGLIHHRCKPQSGSGVSPLSPSVPSVVDPALRSTPPQASWDNVKRWADQARKFTRAGLVCQVMAGFELNSLHKAFEFRPGKHTDRILLHDGGGQPQLSWPELVEKYAGVSENTANRWRMMADGIKPRLKKLDHDQRLRSLLETNPADWTAADSTLIEQAVLRVTDGYTQTEFLLELGAAKRPTGSGGARPRPEAPVTASEQIDALKQAALKDANALFTTTRAMGDAYLHLENALLEAVDAELAAHRAAIKYLLTTAPTARDLDQFHRLLAGKA